MIAHPVRLAFLLLIAWLFPHTVWSQGTNVQPSGKEITAQQYVEELRSASEALDGKHPDKTHDFRHSLPSEWIVRLDGQVLKVKTDWLADALFMLENSPSASPDRLQQSRQRLAALRELAENLTSRTGAANLAQSRGQLDRILRGREFQGAHGPSWFDKYRARAFAWISRQLEKLFGHVGISQTAGNAIAWTLVLIVALFLAVWTVRSLIAAASRSEMDLSGAVPAGQDWRYWANEARIAADRGDYRAAIHAAYWAAVSRLEENRMLPEDRARTPRESLRLVQRSSAAYTPLAQLTRRFELTWYGYHAATSADWDDAMRQLETLGCLRSSTAAIAGS